MLMFPRIDGIPGTENLSPEQELDWYQPIRTDKIKEVLTACAAAQGIAVLPTLEGHTQSLPLPCLILNTEDAEVDVLPFGHAYTLTLYVITAHEKQLAGQSDEANEAAYNQCLALTERWIKSLNTRTNMVILQAHELLPLPAKWPYVGLMIKQRWLD